MIENRYHSMPQLKADFDATLETEIARMSEPSLQVVELWSVLFPPLQ